MKGKKFYYKVRGLGERFANKKRASDAIVHMVVGAAYEKNWAAVRRNIKLKPRRIRL